MSVRFDFQKNTPEAARKLGEVQKYVEESGLDKRLLELVRLRASQINGCVYCIDLHTRAAAALGESQQRLHGLVAWREAPFYTERERAALGWAESVTLIAQDHAPDEVYANVREHFSEREVADLTWALALINAWNRMAVALRLTPKVVTA